MPRTVLFGPSVTTRALVAHAARCLSGLCLSGLCLSGLCLSGLCLSGLGGCTIDTELGVGAEALNASVTVTDDGTTVGVDVLMNVRFRVGENAQSTQSFVPTTLGVNAGEMNAANGTIRAIAGFDGVLSPGEERELAIRNDPMGFTIQPDARQLLCGGAEVRVVLSYEFSEGTRGPTDLPDFRTVAFAPAVVTCP